MTTTLPTWLCPLCSRVRVPYGENCANGDACENRQHAHVTGAWYLRAQANADAVSVGIAAISDEDGQEVEVK